MQVNRQRLSRNRDLLRALRVSVFAPDDLSVVRGGPAGRRRLLDDTLVALSPKNDDLRGEVDRVLRQRNALLKQAAGRLSPEVELTLDVWDAKLVESGTLLGERRVALLDDLLPYLATAYADLAGAAVEVGRATSRRGGGRGRSRRRAASARRGAAAAAHPGGAPPRRVGFSIAGLPAHPRLPGRAALAGAALLAGRAPPRHRRDWDIPVLLLDDVFSELDRPVRRPRHTCSPPAPRPSSPPPACCRPPRTLRRSSGSPRAPALAGLHATAYPRQCQADGDPIGWTVRAALALPEAADGDVGSPDVPGRPAAAVYLSADDDHGPAVVVRPDDDERAALEADDSSSCLLRRPRRARTGPGRRRRRLVRRPGSSTRPIAVALQRDLRPSTSGRDPGRLTSGSVPELGVAGVHQLDARLLLDNGTPSQSEPRRRP